MPLPYRQGKSLVHLKSTTKLKTEFGIDTTHKDAEGAAMGKVSISDGNESNVLDAAKRLQVDIELGRTLDGLLSDNEPSTLG